MGLAPALGAPAPSREHAAQIKSLAQRRSHVLSIDASGYAPRSRSRRRALLAHTLASRAVRAHPGAGISESTHRNFALWLSRQRSRLCQTP